MAKKITTKTTLYSVSADVVLCSDGEISITQFCGEGSATKSKRELSKNIRETYEADGFEVIAIRNLTTTKYYEIHSYSVEATNGEILDACMAAGITVRELLESDTNAETDDEAE